MSPDDFITKLQKQPYNTRVRILWGTMVVVAIILFILWIFSLKSTIGRLDTNDLLTGSAAGINSTQISYAWVERVEAGSANLKIYFNFNNITDDILNVSTLANISLTVDGKKTAPSQMTDRQGRTFVQKILSHTQNFGILTFPKTDADEAELTFDHMFFERSPEQTLVQKMDLDLKKLEKTDKLRN